MGMPDLKGDRARWAAVLAVVIAVVGAVLLRATFAATSSGGPLPPVSAAVAATWLIGGIVVVAAASTTRPPDTTEPSVRFLLRALRQPPTRMQGFPVAAAVAVGLAFAIVCVIGALTLLRFPWTAQWVSAALTTARGDAAIVFSVALATGAAEEVFFRIGLRSVLPARWYVLASTVIYGVVTAATGNGALVIASILLGLVAAQMYYWFPRWYVPVIIHALWTVGVIGIFPTLSSY
ncbi:CPBP family intramembrane glutamic endopeptidase [Tsukamurella paurometabola]|nr:CPBP family intramembrane glutamic endopeptidase [Tsukamurella paurometabola]